MTLRWILAFLHLLALPIGIAAILLRARALHALARGAEPHGAVRADLWWGVAAFLWISTGLIRWLAGSEKPMPYYTQNWLFHAKLTMLLLILILEVRPIIVIGRWRKRLRTQQPADTSAAATSSGVSSRVSLQDRIVAHV